MNCGSLAAAPPLDPTYGMAPLPPSHATAGGEWYLAHMPIRPVEIVDVHPGHGAITGQETLISGKGTQAKLEITPVAETDADPPTLLVDFGKEISGRVAISGPIGAIVHISTGESRAEAENAPIADDSWAGPTRLVIAGGAPQFTPNSGFRYARIAFFGTSAGTPYTITQIYLDHRYYPVAYQGSFNCSDSGLTKLWYMGAYTAHLCMQDDIWDSPKRDRVPNAADLDVSGGVIDNVFADHFLMEQTISDLIKQANGGEVNGMPSCSAAWLSALADYYRHSGRIEFVRSQHQALLGLITTLHGDFNADNVFTNSSNSKIAVDEAPGFDASSPQSLATTQLFVIRGLHDAVDLLDAVGDTTNAKKCSDWADQLAIAVQNQAQEPAAPQPFGVTRQENAMAIESGVVGATSAQRQAIYKNVLAPGTDASNQVATPYFNYFVLLALDDMGHGDDALKFARSYWGGMIQRGATTFWERYDPSWAKDDYHLRLGGYSISLCRGGAGGITSFLTERVLGVRPLTGGYAQTQVSPELSDLSWVEGVVPTPHGQIRVRAVKTKAATAINVILPAGVQALTGGTGSTLLVNGGFGHVDIHGNGKIWTSLKGPGVFQVTVIQ
jgi:hypothetical protein